MKVEKEEFTPKKLFVILVELVLLFMLAVIVVGVLQQFVLSPMMVKGSSMSPTIRSDGDKVYVYRNTDNIEKGDVIVFYRPLDGINVESENPASKKKTFTEFIRALPIVGGKITVGHEEDDNSGSNYKCLIKRVVGCPGDIVEFVDGELYVNHIKEERFEYKWDKVKIGDTYDGNYSHTLTEGEYFVLGDNRGNSYDSEDFGPITESMIYGKVVVLITDGSVKTSF